MEGVQKCKIEVGKVHSKSILYRSSQTEKKFMGKEVWSCSRVLKNFYLDLWKWDSGGNSVKWNGDRKKY